MRLAINQTDQINRPACNYWARVFPDRGWEFRDMEHPRVRSEYTAAPWKRERPRCDGRPWQSDPLGFKGTGLPHHRRAGVSDRVATINSVAPHGVVSLDRVLPGPSSKSKSGVRLRWPHWFGQNMFHFLSGGSQWAGYAAVSHVGRLSKHTPSGVRPSQDAAVPCVFHWRCQGDV